MADYDNKPGFGAMFRTKEKKSDKSPDSEGNLCCPLCEGQLRLAGWLREGKSGQKYNSLKAEPKEPKEQPASKPSGSGFDDMAEDIPF